MRSPGEDRPLPALRPAAVGIAVLAGLVFLFGLGVTAFHHHEREDGARSCAVCSLGHATATVTALVDASAPAVRIERILPDPLGEPRSFRLASAKSRAPPLN